MDNSKNTSALGFPKCAAAVSATLQQDMCKIYAGASPQTDVEIYAFLCKLGSCCCTLPGHLVKFYLPQSLGNLPNVRKLSSTLITPAIAVLVHRVTTQFHSGAIVEASSRSGCTQEMARMLGCVLSDCDVVCAR